MSNLVLDCSRPFDLTRLADEKHGFIGKEWKIVEQDERALALTQIDFSAVLLETCLMEGEKYITGGVKLQRLQKADNVRLAGQHCFALLEDWLANGNDSVLEHLRQQHGQITLSFFGTIIQLKRSWRRWNPDRKQHFFELFCFSQLGGWHLSHQALFLPCFNFNVAVCLPPPRQAPP